MAFADWSGVELTNKKKGAYVFFKVNNQRIVNVKTISSMYVTGREDNCIVRAELITGTVIDIQRFTRFRDAEKFINDLWIIWSK